MGKNEGSLWFLNDETWCKITVKPPIVHGKKPLKKWFYGDDQWEFQDQWEIFRIQQMEVRKRTICLAIFCGDIPWKIGLKFRPYIR